MRVVGNNSHREPHELKHITVTEKVTHAYLLQFSHITAHTAYLLKLSNFHFKIRLQPVIQMKPPSPQGVKRKYQSNKTLSFPPLMLI